MSFESVLSVANAALYEGYALYPYRASSIKNRVRFPFGGIYPPKYARAQTGADRCEVFAEFLVRSTPDTRLHLRLRFLQLCTPEPAGTERSETSGVSWQPAEERNLEFSAELAARRFEFALPAAGRAARPLTGALELSVQPLEPSLVRVRVAVENLSESPALERDGALAETLISAQLLARSEAGSFVSLLEPPAEHEQHARACTHGGLFPVLVGPRGSSDTMLAAPLVFYDFPEVAGESPGDLFDLTEIDEILTLRIQTLGAEEKREMRELEPRVARLLERSEGLADAELARLHGARRDAQNGAPRAGTRVRLMPRRRADIFDLALAGRIATVRAVERDFEDRVYLSVTVDDDPGQDLGLSGQPGHRFFFFLDEVEVLAVTEQS